MKTCPFCNDTYTENSKTCGKDACIDKLLNKVGATPFVHCGCGQKNNRAAEVCTFCKKSLSNAPDWVDPVYVTAPNASPAVAATKRSTVGDGMRIGMGIVILIIILIALFSVVGFFI